MAAYFPNTVDLRVDRHFSRYIDGNLGIVIKGYRLCVLCWWNVVQQAVHGERQAGRKNMQSCRPRTDRGAMKGL